MLHRRRPDDDGLPEVDYPLCGRDIFVTLCGRISPRCREINISTAPAGQPVAIKEVDDHLLLASFIAFGLG